MNLLLEIDRTLNRPPGLGRLESVAQGGIWPEVRTKDPLAQQSCNAVDRTVRVAAREQ